MTNEERMDKAIKQLIGAGWHPVDIAAVVTGLYDPPTDTTWRGWLKRFKVTRHDIANAFRAPRRAAKAWAVGVLGLGVSWLAGKGIILPDGIVDDQLAIVGHLVDALVLAIAAWAVPND